MSDLDDDLVRALTLGPADAEAELRRLEWSFRRPSDPSVPRCPVCAMPRDQGHNQCWLGGALDRFAAQSSHPDKMGRGRP